MLNTVISSVCTAVYESFGDEYKIYKELVKQNLTSPCFFIDCDQTNRTQGLNNRFFREHVIAIYYFPQNEDFRAECNDIISKLQSSLAYILIEGNLVRGKNLKFAYTDFKKSRSEFSHTVLKINVNFDFFTYENITEQTMMQELELFN